MKKTLKRAIGVVYARRPNPDKTDHVLMPKSKLAELILRLKRKIQRKTIKPLTVADILAVPMVGRNFEPDEKNFLINAVHNYSLALEQFRKQNDRDALLFIHLSYEMFLKHLWTKMKYAYHDAHTEDIPIQSKDENPRKTHDLAALLSHLQSCCDFFRTDPAFDNLRFDASTVNQNIGDWASARYKSPNVETRPNIYSVSFQNLRDNYRNVYRSVKQHGEIRWN